VDIISARLHVAPEQVTRDAKVEDLGADSFDVLSLVSQLETRFDLDIPVEAARNVRTVGEIADFLSARVGGLSAAAGTTGPER
jgi:acyl carrier protein